MKYSYGIGSQKKLNTCTIDLQKVMNLTLQRSAIDITIVQGGRAPEKQFEYYKKGRQLTSQGWVIVNKREVITNVDGYKKIGKHNKVPSEAVDICAYHPDKQIDKLIRYDKMHLAYIAGTAICCAQELFDKGEITSLIRWGGNWDKDGELYFDQTLKDLPHLETYTP